MCECEIYIVGVIVLLASIVICYEFTSLAREKPSEPPPGTKRRAK